MKNIGTIILFLCIVVPISGGMALGTILQMMPAHCTVDNWRTCTDNVPHQLEEDIMAKSQKQMINMLNKKWPQLNAVPYSEFTGQDDNGNGIWLRSEGEYIDDMPVHDCYNNDLTGEIYHFNTLKVLEDYLQANGWYSESYDAGTLMAYKI